MQQDDGLQSFFRLIAPTQPSSRLAKKPIKSTPPQFEVSDMSCAEDLDSASSQSSHPKSDFSTAKEEMSREWMFSGTLTVKTDEEWAALRWRGLPRRAAVVVQRQLRKHRIAAAAALRREGRRRGGALHRRGPGRQAHRR